MKTTYKNFDFEINVKDIINATHYRINELLKEKADGGIQKKIKQLIDYIWFLNTLGERMSYKKFCGMFNTLYSKGI